jgi:hypothetical protein
MATAPAIPTKTWKLPPLILHPFAETGGTDQLVESSRASLMLQGLIPSGELSRAELDERLISGRYCEIRMLFYVGRDLIRWIEQCLDLVDRDADLKRAGMCYQAFAALLSDDPPRRVREKLKKWGVADYRSIFSRALGLNAIFAEMPERETLADEFIRHYYRYADQLYLSRQLLWNFSEIRPQQFEFELYASGEYSRMLEREWGGDEDDLPGDAERL